jgi:uncharacterized membrane protein YgdD (TMEM256/DUF423 family)
MIWDQRMVVRLAAVSAFIAVAAGAFAAHGLSDPPAKELIRTGSNYEAIHALAALICVALGPARARRLLLPATLFLCGTLLFSGSLYALALGAPRWTGAITPFGGLMFLTGWASLAWTASGLAATD